MKKILVPLALIGAVFLLVKNPEFAGSTIADAFAAAGAFLRGLFA